jgi:hypothetical protein
MPEMLAEMEDRVQQLCAAVASLVEERDALMEQLQVDEAILTGSMGSQVAPSESEMFLAAADQEQVRFGSLLLPLLPHRLPTVSSNSAQIRQAKATMARLRGIASVCVVRNVQIVPMIPQTVGHSASKWPSNGLKLEGDCAN